MVDDLVWKGFQFMALKVFGTPNCLRELLSTQAFHCPSARGRLVHLLMGGLETSLPPPSVALYPRPSFPPGIMMVANGEWGAGHTLHMAFLHRQHHHELYGASIPRQSRTPERHLLQERRPFF